MLKSIFTEIRKLNLFGREMQFEKDFSNRFNSISSFVLTVIVIVALTIVSFLFGQEIYQRKNPKVSGSFKTVTVNETVIDMNEFPILIGFLNPSGFNVNQSTIDSLFTFSTFHTDILKNGTGYATQNTLEPCSSQVFSNPEIQNLVNQELDLSKKNGLFNYCFKKSNNSLKNSRGSFDSGLSRLSITRCSRNCSPNINQTIEGMYFLFSHIDTFVDPKNYTKPFKYNLIKHSIKMSSSLSKEMTFSFSNNELYTNKGWILEDIETEKYFSLKEVTSEVFISSRTIINLFIDSPIFVTTIFREYMKLQDLLANIGGFFNASLLLINLFFSHYFRFSYYDYVINKLVIFSTKENELVKDELSESKKHMLRNNYINSNFRSIPISSINSNQNNNLNEENRNFNRNIEEDDKRLEDFNKYNNHIKKLSTKKDMDKYKDENNDKDKEKDKEKDLELKESKSNKIKIRKIENKTSTMNELKNENEDYLRDNLRKKGLEFKIENANPQSINKTQEENKKITSQFELSSNYEESYIKFLWNNFICCDKKNDKEYKVLEKILSFDSYIEKSAFDIK